MIRLAQFILLFVLFGAPFCYAKQPQFTDFLSGFKAVRVQNDKAFCATEGGLRIYDLTDHVAPRFLSEIMVSESGNITMELSGSYVYVLSGYIWLEQSYVTVIDISNITQPKIISRYSNLEDSQVTDLLIYDRWLIVANGENIDFLDTSNPSRLKRVSQITITSFEGSVRGLAIYNNTLFAVWENFGDSGLVAVDISVINTPKKIVTYYYPRLNGYQRPSGFVTISDSTVYVSVPTLGLLMFDADNPQYLVPISSLEGENFYDIDAIHAEQDFLFVNFANRETQEIGIFDITNAPSPSLIKQSAIPISVIGMTYDSARREAYAGVSSSKGFGLGIFHLSEQGDLNLLSNDIVPNASDVTVSNDTVFLAVSDGLVVGKMVNGNFDFISKLPISNLCRSIRVEGNRAFVTTSDNLQRSFLNTIDIRNPQQMKLLGKYQLKDVPGYLSRDTYDVEGTRLFIAGNNGLTIVDLSNPGQPHRIGFFAIAESLGPGLIEVEQGIAFVGTLHYQTEGELVRAALHLRVIDVRHPQTPKLITQKMIAYATTISDITLRDGFLYLMFAGFGGDLLPVGDGQLAIVDVQTPSKPELLYSGFTRKHGTGYAEEIVFRENLAFIADGLQGVTVINLVNKSRPEILATLTTPGYAKGISVDDAGWIHITDNTSYVVYRWP
jgi:hypothetical protein